MKALAALSKYSGCYDKWTDIRERHQLNWSNENGIESFTDMMMNNEVRFSSMLAWLRHTCSEISTQYGSILIYCTLTGLRPTEAVQSLSLLRSAPDAYPRDGVFLEHFRYPNIFLRPTKKAYISIATHGLLEVAKSAGAYSYNACHRPTTGKNSKISIRKILFQTRL
jgi:hypothetical protein